MHASAVALTRCVLNAPAASPAFYVKDKGEGHFRHQYAALPNAQSSMTVSGVFFSPPPPALGATARQLAEALKDFAFAASLETRDSFLPI